MELLGDPEGPLARPGGKRLAVEVGDHATSHNTFEGAIDAGGVIVWDHGTYEQGAASPERPVVR